jgi:ATPase subunit of ABC transporter with duplicated ATPase domains
VDGFPDRSEVLTVYVAHDIQSQDKDPRVVDYLSSDSLVQEKGLDAAACRKALEEIGFDSSRIDSTVSTLSGAALLQACNGHAAVLALITTRNALRTRALV